MEEEKAAAYYDELTRKGSGAAKFKQGLGFSSAASTTVSDDAPPSRGSALPSSSSFMSSFVKASSPGKSKELERQSQIQSIQNKLKSKTREDSKPRIDRKDEIRARIDRKDEIRARIDRKDDRKDKIRVRVSDRDRDRDRRRSRSRSRSRERRRDRSRRRSRSRESSRRRYRSTSRERTRDRREKRSRSRSRSLSPRGRRRKTERGRKEGSKSVDYSKLIDGYDKMTPAERVKAKMKLQLSQTAEKDGKMGVGSQWERFDFDKDAPLEDEVLEAADDDAAVSKRINQSFRFASLEGKREDEIRNAHDEAMFGVPVAQPSQTSESENDDRPTNETATDPEPATSLLNEKVLSKQQGSWRDRARRNAG